MNKKEQDKIKDIEEFCRYLNGGGYNTSDIEWLIKEYLKLKLKK